MKFFLTLSFLFLSSVGILYYLITNSNFLPTDATGELNWLNISVFAFLLLIFVFSLLSFLVFLVIHILKKEYTFRKKSFSAVKISLMLTIGLFVVTVLHFFHILDILWGLLILFVVLVALIVI